MRLLILLAAVSACAPAIRHARLDPAEPPSDRELDAEWRVASRSCGGTITILFPGIAQICHHRSTEGALLMTLGAAELATGVAVGVSSPLGTDHPGSGMPLIAFQDLWVYSLIDARLDGERAMRLPYVPQDNLGELVVAPWSWRVLGRPEVWAGILATTAVGFGVSLLVDSSIHTDRFGENPNLFGSVVDARAGYPLAAAVGISLFSHVAVAEETLFRGYFQSGLTRQSGETTGWLAASAIFGAAHALNAFLLPSDQRLKYLAFGVPTITLTGAYLGLVYRWNDYSMAPPVAVHFWYDFLLSAVFFAMDPQNSPVSASFGGSF